MHVSHDSENPKVTSVIEVRARESVRDFTGVYCFFIDDGHFNNDLLGHVWLNIERVVGALGVCGYFLFFLYFFGSSVFLDS